MRTYGRFGAVLALLLSLCLMLCACSGTGSRTEYQDPDHTCVYGFWYDAAPKEGEDVTKEVRYCKICHAEQIREKE